VHVPAHEWDARLAADGPPNLLTVNEATIETDASGWNGGLNSACTVARSTAQAAEGVASLAITSTAAASTIQAALLNAKPATAGLPYAATAMWRAATAGAAPWIYIQFLDVNGANLGSTGNGAANDTTTGWTQASVVGTAPASTTQARIWLNLWDQPVGTVHYVDQIGLFQSATVPAWTP